MQVFIAQVACVYASSMRFESARASHLMDLPGLQTALVFCGTQLLATSFKSFYCTVTLTVAVWETAPD
jgi:hypothetical protein